MTIYALPTLATNLTDTVSVGGDEPEPFTNNNYAGVTSMALEAPRITMQSQSQTVSSGATVTFSVAATNAMPLQVAWGFSGLTLGLEAGPSAVSGQIRDMAARTAASLAPG